ncbi:MAG: hypothetical protein Kow0042_05800 [Calditrichia bacterium]
MMGFMSKHRIGLVPLLLLLTVFPAAARFSGCYLGAYTGGGAYDSTYISPQDFSALSGKTPAVFTRYLNSGDHADLFNPDHWSWANSLLPLDASPAFFLMPFDGLAAYANGSRDADLNYFAQSAALLNRPVFIIFGHEMNGPWSLWGQQPAEYVAAFQRVAQVMKSANPLIQMCWVPGQAWGYPWGGGATGQGYEEYYPGDSAVDWVGLTIHDRDWNENNQVEPGLFDAAVHYLDFYQNYAASRLQPMLLAETAQFDGNWDPTPPGVRVPLTPQQMATEKNQWVAQVYDAANLSTNFPWLKLIIWFHVGKVENLSTQSHNFGPVFTDYRLPLEGVNNLYSMLVADPYFQSGLITPIDQREAKVAQSHRLLCCYPNPFNSRMAIRVELPRAGVASIRIFDLRGKEVQRIHRGRLSAGEHRFYWDGEGRASGMYFVRLNFPGYSASHKILLVR